MQAVTIVVACTALAIVLLPGAGASNANAQEVSLAAGAAAERAPATTSAQPEGPTLRTGHLPPEMTLDGTLSEAAWAAADSITNLQTIEPEEGQTPVGRTIVKVLANQNELLIGVVCHDPDPAAIVSYSKARDAELDDEDHVVIVLDTFRDNRSGYVFAVNPSGTRFDGIVSAQGTDVNSDWDALWEARTSQDASGWSAEIRIPVKSVGFKPGLTTWGLNIERRVERLQETSRWAGVSQDYEIFQTSRAGFLTDVPNFDLGMGLSIRPAITLGGSRDAEDPTDLTTEPSLDVTQKLGANFLSSLTVNTDFAETETDARQTNLTRFEILFPEKRTFFLEGADIFEFGLGLDDILVPFFSRRIGLGPEGIEIPVNVGGKLNGRAGHSNVGALVVNTRDVDGIEGGAATVGAARVKQNIFAESSVGMIATVGDQLGRANAWTTGADFTYQTSRLRGDKNFIATAWALMNDRADLEGDRSAYGFGVDYPNDRWNFRMTSAHVGDGFDPSLGFVPRNGVRLWDGAAAFEPRPGKAGVRQMSHTVSGFLVNDLENVWESYDVELKPFDWLLESGERFEFNVALAGDRPDEEFEVFEGPDDDVVIPAGSYEWRQYGVKGSLSEKRRISGEVKWEFGSFYGGDLDTIEATLALKGSLFRLELGAERNIGQLPGGEFVQNLYSGRLEIKVSPDLQVASFVQYDNESDSLGSNTRLRWTFHPLGDLFVVYNHSLQRSLDELRTRWLFEANALVVKLQYAWRP